MTELEKDEQFYRDTESVAFPKLDDRQLAMLEPLGPAHRAAGRDRIQGGPARHRPDGRILRGEIEVFERATGRRKSSPTAGPRDFIGDVAMLMGTAALASARGKAEETEILRRARGSSCAGRSRNCPASASRS